MNSCARFLPSEAEASEPVEPPKIGSDAQKTLYYRTLLDAFEPYRPTVIDRANFDDVTREPARDVNGSTQNNNFTVAGASQVGLDITLAELLDICLAENDLRLGIYDPCLLRPRIDPALARFARRFTGRANRSSRT